MALSKDKKEIKQKLCDFNDKAFKDLTDGVKMIYESGQVTIKAPIATHANVGPYTFKVQADAPNHFSGSVKLEPLSGVVEKENRKFSYTAEVEFKVDVTWHPTPKGNPEPVKVKAADEGRARELSPSTNIDLNNPYNSALQPGWI